MRSSFLEAAVLLAAVAGNAAAQPGAVPTSQPTLAIPEPTPRPGPARLFAEVMGAAAGGVFIFIPGALAGAGIYCGVSDCESNTGYEAFGAALVGGALGYLIGAPIGAYVVGTHDEQTGSFGATLLGGVAGAGLGALELLIGTQLAGEYRGGVLLVLGPPVGAVVGFSLSRRYERSAPRIRLGALWQVD